MKQDYKNYFKEYFKKPEWVKYRRSYYQANKEKISLSRKEYYIRNKERILKRNEKLKRIFI